MHRQRQRLEIEGAVQGVGFRPFIYNLALRLGLTGWVRNTSKGVLIEVQGTEDGVLRFREAIVSAHPPLAQPNIVSCQPMAIVPGESAFTIATSQAGATRQVAITPDAATCDDCLAELADPNDRRYRYPFINCTNCGPRYTIVFDIPYDRPNTTMHRFTMCAPCRREYEDPANRRFHAQPNACAVCGPRVWLADAAGAPRDTNDPVREAIGLLEKGDIIAIKGLGGFHLAVRADEAAAVERLRQRKYRKAKAFAVMVRDVDQARRLAYIDPPARTLLQDYPRPIVLCPKKPGALVSAAVAPSSRFMGILLPYTPLHTLLMAGDYPALVMTSGNNADDPIESTNEKALAALGEITDWFLLHNRDIYTACDDSVVKVFRDEPMVLRRARGYVPWPIPLRRHSRADILAVGAELKNTITYLKADQAYVSQHIGDLKGTSTYESFLRTVEKMGALIGAEPAVVACDLHPAMLSTQFAKSYRQVRRIAVQHHHAHIAAVLGEHDLEGPVAGLALDGTGYGADGTVWGCECLGCWRDRYQRFGHLEYVPMPTGDAASREPWRMAVSYLVTTFGREKAVELACQRLKDIDPDRIATIAALAEKAVRSPRTSSLGRLFDGVSALLGIGTINTYDAQAAIELENAVAGALGESYPVILTTSAGLRILEIPPVIEAILRDLDQAVAVPVIAGRFHHFVVAGLSEMVGELAQSLSTDRVALAGGVLQNDVILNGLVERLSGRELRVFFNRELPVNDGAISFGQAVVADAVLAVESACGEQSSSDGR